MLFMLLQPPPPPPDNTALEAELENKQEEIDRLKENNKGFRLKINNNRTAQDSLLNLLEQIEERRRTDNEAVYKIPDSNLNDIVHNILRGI